MTCPPINWKRSVIFGSEITKLITRHHKITCKPFQTRTINLNEFGDDYVSFAPLHLSFSPDGLYFLVSTGELVVARIPFALCTSIVEVFPADRDRLIMYSWKTGTLVSNNTS